MPLTQYDSSSHDGSITANIVQIAERRIFAADLCWTKGLITAIKELGIEDPGLLYLLPGFIDAHVHVESSMLTPSEFARLAVRHGTVAAVSDPHEIANVMGVPGVQFMLDNARQTPFKFYFGAPSCVPATEFESTGARLDCEELKILFQNQDIHYLSEMMNYPGVLADEPNILAKLNLAKQYDYRIDGHAPGLTGKSLLNYVAKGISSDHECKLLSEAEEKLASGMAILIREGSAARNFNALQPLISSHTEHIMFCSDDKHPDDLQLGHINSLVARACALGHDFFDVLQCACINPIHHYGLSVGQLGVGESMDAVLVDNLTHFTPIKTWISGQLVSSQGRSLLPYLKSRSINHFQARKIQLADFMIADPYSNVRVIKALDGQLLTEQALLKPKVLDGKIIADVERDILWLTVINRYQPALPAVALVQGFGLHHGALASSVAHDSHNIVAVGCDAVSLCRAVNGLIDSQGGIACAFDNVFESLPLPIAGLMSYADGDCVAARYAELDKLAKQMGSTLKAPFMTLSFMALLVIPALKLSDKGLFDGNTFQFTSLTV